MSIINSPVPPDQIKSLTLREAAEVLVKHFDIHEGIYDLMLEFHIGVGPVGPSPDAMSPGAMVGVSRIGIAKAAMKGPNTVDAAVCNPKKGTRAKAK